MKAAIVGLVRGYSSIQSYWKLVRRNRMLHRNFNKHFGYPVIIFHEGNIHPSHQSVISKLTPNIVFFDVSGKAFFEPSDLPIEYKNQIGYKHMCRFYAMQMYDLVGDFDYIMRLDDDSYIDSPIKYDLFSFMQKRNFIYGYIHKENDYHKDTVTTLPAFTQEYIRKNNIQINCTLDDINALYYYSNFVVTSVPFWKRPDVQGYLHAVDESLGIYQYRWGDHVIQTLALKMFCEPERIHLFHDFRYSHGSHQWSNYELAVPARLSNQWGNKIRKLFEKHYLKYLLDHLK
jgi:hypothetical protein